MVTKTNTYINPLFEKMSFAPQGSAKWKADRVARFTASTVGLLMTDPRGKKQREAGERSQSFKGLVVEKVLEEMTGEPLRDFNNDATDYGTSMEPMARSWYEVQTGLEVMESGFIKYGDEAGASPDGLVYPRGEVNMSFSPTHGCEIKCPKNPVRHAKWFLLKSLVRLACSSPCHFYLTNQKEEFTKAEKLYYYQIQMNMLATDMKFWDFCSYWPDSPSEKLRGIIIRIYRDNEAIEELKTRLEDAVEMKYALLADWNTNEV